MTIKDLKNILRYYDDAAEVKIILNTDHVHYNYGFYYEDNEAICPAEEDYNPDTYGNDLVIRADIYNSRTFKPAEDAAGN